MMKKITLLLLTFLSFSLGFSQTELLNLSFDAAGSESVWTPIADAASNPSEVNIAFDANGNPTGATLLSGINTSDVAGRAYIFRYNNASFDFGTSGSVSISMDVKIDAALTGTNLVFETQVSKVGGGVVVVTHNNVQNDVAVGGGWIPLTFDMTPNPAEFNNAGTELYFYFNMAAGAFVGAGGTFLVDNIVVTGGAPAEPTCDDGLMNGDETGVDCGGPDCSACIEDPTDAPSELASTGTDLYAYSGLSAVGESDLPGFNFTAFNGGVTISEETLSGNKVGKLANLDFFGSGWTPIDVTTAYTYVHLDYYAVSGTWFEFFLIDDSLSATICCGSGEEPRYRFGPAPSGQDEPLVLGAWTSVFIPLSDFANYAALTNGTWDGTDIKETKFTSDGGTIYFDNIYFSTSNVLGVDDFESTSFSVYPNPTQESWTIKAQNTKITNIKVYDVLGKNVMMLSPNTIETKIDGASLMKGIYFAKIETVSGTSSVKLVKQ
ncbi:Por secretion system C-terminal sorting domain-containing protein [Hyunsoonleella jejuensis]|uniref:Por secretion system C-terminal sorting domain-containing protein n=1 Tax=Hyunsoonleella jejuensis TaxID=419940 RepID=A0A1H9B3M2_9FLAO|nr:T9SS type A sorting domain-containing protein [Hyunsoonleella jejuensis]SEP83650.1 Por secretion system C-terminal sorting domain-containing protein [Hyunsoonleella jejuensis]